MAASTAGVRRGLPPGVSSEVIMKAKPPERIMFTRGPSSHRPTDANSVTIEGSKITGFPARINSAPQCLETRSAKPIGASGQPTAHNRPDT